MNFDQNQTLLLVAVTNFLDNHFRIIIPVEYLICVITSGRGSHALLIALQEAHLLGGYGR